jgi:phosphoglycolate phosphatase-like HAD superfamily hydrolase
MANYVFDLDGTLADCSHRLHHIQNGKKDWKAFFAACFDDKPIEHMVDLFKDLCSHHGNLMIVCSGRSDITKADTDDWLTKHDLIYDYLFMREEGDHRPDDVVKLEMLTKLRVIGIEPTMVFDDRNSVVNMWREAGVPCAQVAPGDF